MTTNQPVKRIAGASSRLKAKFVLAYYLITMLAGAFVLSFHGRFALIADLLLTVLYLTLTGFLYRLSRSQSHDLPPMRRPLQPAVVKLNFLARGLAAARTRRGGPSRSVVVRHASPLVLVKE